MTIMGTRVQRKEDPTFLTEGATYTADLDDPRLEGALHATFVRSVVANGRILLSGSGRELLANKEIRAAYLEGGH